MLCLKTQPKSLLASLLCPLTPTLGTERDDTAVPNLSDLVASLDKGWWRRERGQGWAESGHQELGDR